MNCSFKNIDKSKGYRVHMNLHKNCFSVSQYIIEKKGWRVTNHVSTLEAEDITFNVSEVSRQRALRKGSRNVHAYAHAKSVKLNPVKILNTQNVCNYNPFKNSQFYNLETGEHIFKLEKAYFSNGKINY